MQGMVGEKGEEFKRQVRRRNKLQNSNANIQKIFELQ
jgi:hypothetical protein